MYFVRNIEFSLFVYTGLIVGAFIRYTGSTISVVHMSVSQDKSDKYNMSLPPDSLWLRFPNKAGVTNKTYSYIFRGEIVDMEGNEIDYKVRFLTYFFF